MTGQLTPGVTDADHSTSRISSKRRNRRREAAVAYAFIAPALIAFILFMAIPMIFTAVLSFFKWTGISFGSLSFIGFGNYVQLSQDPVFLQAFLNNMIFIALGMSVSVALGLFLAVLLERNLPGSSFIRGVFFFPTVISGVVIAIVFTFILSPVFGILAPLLELVGIDFKTALLGDPKTVLYTIIAIQVWRSFGFAMFLFVAGLKSLDETLVEAAKLDGANSRQVFWFVTFPQLRPVTLLVSTLVAIDMLKLFDLVYILTLGGPQHASEVLTTFSYAQAFNYNNVGYGSTIAVVLLVITFLVTILRFKLLPDSRETVVKGEL